MMGWRGYLALATAAAVFLLLVVVFKIANWFPLIAAGIAGALVLLVTAPRRRVARAKPRDPAIAELDAAARTLGRHAQNAPPADAPLFRRMADLTAAIRDHHGANPDHAALTARFRRHALGRMVASVDDYMALLDRAGPDQQDRLMHLSRELEAFVPALEKIDRACLDNDLTALEIHVDVLNDQLDRRRV